MSPFAKVLDKIIEESKPTNEGITEVVIKLKDEEAISGQLRKHPTADGCYSLLTVGYRGQPDPKKPPDYTVENVFMADSVTLVTFAKALNPSSLILPDGSGQIVAPRFGK